MRDFLFNLRQWLAPITNPIKVYFLFRKVRHHLDSELIYFGGEYNEYTNAVRSGVFDAIPAGTRVDTVASIELMIPAIHNYNYRTEEEDVQLTFKNLHNVMVLGKYLGILTYDRKTKHFYKRSSSFE